MNIFPYSYYTTRSKLNSFELKIADLNLFRNPGIMNTSPQAQASKMAADFPAFRHDIKMAYHRQIKIVDELIVKYLFHVALDVVITHHR